jgi:hypothetical protein
MDQRAAVTLVLAADRELKAWQTLQARFRLAGYRADLVDGNDSRAMLVVGRWTMTRSFGNLEAAEQFFLKVSGIKPCFEPAQDVSAPFSQKESCSDSPPASATS